MRDANPTKMSIKKKSGKLPDLMFFILELLSLARLHRLDH